MTPRLQKIICDCCGEESVLKRVPVYEGFTKVGERILCAACGHEYAAEEDASFKERDSEVLGELEDVPELFADEEKKSTCRHCVYYLMNPFTQRCGLRFKPVEATDSCEDFKPKESDEDS
jgi:hypothetical protein